jgi:hypothetical protein
MEQAGGAGDLPGMKTRMGELRMELDRLKQAIGDARQGKDAIVKTLIADDDIAKRPSGSRR